MSLHIRDGIESSAIQEIFERHESARSNVTRRNPARSLTLKCTRPRAADMTIFLEGRSARGEAYSLDRTLETHGGFERARFGRNLHNA